MAGNRPSAFFFTCIGSRIERQTRSIIMQKRRRPIFSQIDLTRLGNKGLFNGIKKDSIFLTEYFDLTMQNTDKASSFIITVQNSSREGVVSLERFSFGGKVYYRRACS